MRMCALVLGIVASCACGSESTCTADTAAGTSSVDLKSRAFRPACLKVSAGNTITFRNVDSTDHTVTTDAGQSEPFDSGAIAPGSQFQRAFTTAGTIQVR